MLTALDRALDRRSAAIPRWHAEGTDCYRLLHGAVEDAPGVTVDRYGPILLIQTWREVAVEVDRLRARAEEAVGAELIGVWNHRGAPTGSDRPGARSVDFARHHPVTLPDEIVGRELGVAYDVRPRHRGQDPLLFLDLRALRRRVKASARGRSVLNLFAYTGGVGVCAAVGGAREVWNVDFAASALQIARDNARRNGVEVTQVHEDALAVVRQLAGMPAGRRRPREIVAPRSFDLVVLDPPAWSRGPYGAVDVVRDYPGLFKPAVLATAPGGVVAATNHVPSVDRDGWVETLERCARKAGRPLAAVEIVAPEEDFPSPDQRPPLKIAWCTVG